MPKFASRVALAVSCADRVLVVFEALPHTKGNLFEPSSSPRVKRHPRCERIFLTSQREARFAKKKNGLASLCDSVSSLVQGPC